MTQSHKPQFSTITRMQKGNKCTKYTSCDSVYIYKNNCREKIYIVPKSPQSVLHPANGVGSNGFNGLGFDVECIWVG